MKQQIGHLTPQDIDRLERQREWVRGHFDEDPSGNYSLLDGKLRLLQTILDANWIEPHETLKLQCLGVALGDAIQQELDVEWITVTDEQGRDMALRVPGTTVIFFPLTMISKRIERGETVVVREMFDGVIGAIKDAVEKADKIH